MPNTAAEQPAPPPTSGRRGWLMIGAVTVLVLAVAGVAAGAVIWRQPEEQPTTSAEQSGVMQQPGLYTTSSAITATNASTESAAPEQGSVLFPDGYLGFTIGMTMAQARAADPTLHSDHVELTDASGCIGVSVAWGSIYFGIDKAIRWITTSGNARTPEGLAVGDLVSKAVDLYGQPRYGDGALWFPAPGSTTGAQYSVRDGVDREAYAKDPQIPDDAVIESLGIGLYLPFCSGE